MAFALTRFAAYGVDIPTTGKRRSVQRAIMHVTAANTDIALDILNSGGTFWTAAKADSTYGGLATEALAQLGEIVARAQAFSKISGTIENYTRQLTGQYDYGILTSAAASGGAANETLVVTGLAATDTILAVTPSEQGATTFKQLLAYESAASTGGAANETLVVTGLAATDEIVALHESAVGANTFKSLIAYESAASAGGTGVSETLVVTGLLATDEIVSVTQSTGGANTHKTVVPLLSTANAGAGAVVTFAVTGLVATDEVVGITVQTAGATPANSMIIGYGAPGAGTIDVTFNGAPGNGIVVLVSVRRAAGLLPVVDWSDQAANSLKVYWAEDPGAGAKVTVLVKRAAGGIPIVDWSNQAANALKVYWSEDPGAGAKVIVLVKRAAGGVPITDWSNLAANALKVYWTEDPGAGAKVDVLYRRTQTTAGNCYQETVTGKLPGITYVSGSAPTTAVYVLEWDLADDQAAVVADLG